VTDTAAIAVTLGTCDEMRAEVLVRLDYAGGAPGQLVGTVSGPRRRRDTTLPTTTRLVPVAGDVGLSRAVLTEPAYWTPELPNLYRLEAHVEGAAGPEAAIDAVIGLRRLGVRGRSFWLDGHRWVPRAVADAAHVSDLGAARAANLVVAAARPSAALLAATDEAGVAVMAVLDAEELSAAGIAAIARHPSVLLAVVTGAGGGAVSDALPAAVRAAKGTLQLGLAVDGGCPPEPGGLAFDFLAVMVPAGGVPHQGWRRLPACPLVAWRRDAAGAAAGRVACDAVQRDLAAWGMAGGGDHLSWDWAGYVVG
jgi:hypothetical protein